VWSRWDERIEGRRLRLHEGFSTATLGGCKWALATSPPRQTTIVSRRRNDWLHFDAWGFVTQFRWLFSARLPVHG